MPGKPHAHEPAIVSIVTEADATDGIEIVPLDLGSPFSGGLLVMMNSRARNFQLYRWEDVEAALRVR
jgi:hypothetical protein